MEPHDGSDAQGLEAGARPTRALDAGAGATSGMRVPEGTASERAPGDAPAAGAGGGEEAGAGRGAGRLDEISKALEAASTYDHGKSRKPLDALENLLRESRGDPELRGILEDRLLGLLDAGVSAALKWFICRRLWTLGTDRAIPVLGRMLPGTETAEMACYALATSPSPAAVRALRDALGKGGSPVAVIHLLGERRDREAAEALVAIAAGPEGPAALAAVAALGKIASERAVAALTSLHGGADATRRDAAAHALLRSAQELAARGCSDEARAVYARLTGSTDPPPVRRGALLGRIELGGADAAAAALDALQGSEEALAAAALAGVARLRSEETRGMLRKALGDLPSGRRERLEAALTASSR